MKKIITFLAFAISISFIYAQEVKVKKDYILIGELPVTSIKKEKDQFIISDPSGKLYKATIKSVTPNGRKTAQNWVELINKENKVQELSLPPKSGSMEKRVAELLVAEGYVTKSGIDGQKYDSTGNNVTSELDALLDSYEESYAKEDQLAAENSLVLGRGADGFYPVTSNGTVVGYMNGRSIPNPDGSGKLLSQYFAYDTSKQPIAELFFETYDTGNEMKPKMIKTYSDNKEFPIIVKCEFLTLDQEPMAKRMMKILYANGYFK